MFLFFFSPPHISLISIFTFLFFFLSIALRLELYPLIFTFLFSFLLLSSLALRLLQSIQEAPLNVLLPLRLRWVSFAFFFFFLVLIWLVLKLWFEFVFWLRAPSILYMGLIIYMNLYVGLMNLDLDLERFWWFCGVSMMILGWVSWWVLIDFELGFLIAFLLILS